MNDTDRGIHRKYKIERTDGSTGPGGKHEHCRYFVLDLTHDRFSWHALKAYAKACRKEFPELAKDLGYILAGIKNAGSGSDVAETLLSRAEKKSWGDLDDLLVQAFRKLPNERYWHKKTRDCYGIEGFALREADLEPMVHFFPWFHSAVTFSRPVSEFLEKFQDTEPQP